MKYHTEYDKIERKVRLFMYIKNKPHREFRLAVDKFINEIRKTILFKWIK